METTKKAKNPSKRRKRFILIILFAFSLWTSVTVYRQWLDIKKINNNITKLQKEEEETLNLKNQLEEKAMLLQDYDYIAELARKYYFLSKPGEIIFISPKE